MKKFLVIIMVSFITNSFAQTAVWNQKADYGGGEIYDPFCFVIGNKGYVGTGKSQPGNVNQNDFWEYDPTINVWTQKANFMGTGRYGAKGFAIGNYGYAGTGWDPSPKKDFYKYNPVTNVWTAIADFGGSGRYTASAFSVGNYGFLGLGYSGCQNDFWRYDPDNNTWSQSASFLGAARQAATSFVINDTAYVGFGICNGPVFADFYKYDASGNSWNNVTAFPGMARSSAYSFVLNGKGYIVCGNDHTNINSNYTWFNDFWVYNPSTALWTQLPDFPGGKMFSGASFEINGKGYIGMGSDTNVFNVSYTADYWEYSPDTSTSINEVQQTCNGCILYPSPTSGSVYVQLPENKGNYNYSVFNTTGQLVLEGNANPLSNRIQISVDNLSSGLYFLQVSQNGKKIFVDRFLRE